MRFKHGDIAQRAKTNVFVEEEYWSDKEQSIIIPKWRVLTDEKKLLKDELTDKTKRLNEIKELVEKSFNNTDKIVVKDNIKWLTNLIHDYNFPPEPDQEQEEIVEQPSFFDVFTKYIDERDFSLQRKRHMKVVWRTLKRFELYKKVELSFDTITADTLSAIEEFYKEDYISSA